MKYVLSLILALFTLTAYADAETGIYFDPDFPGEGAFVYERDDQVFLAFFTYINVCRHHHLADLRVFDENEFGDRYCRPRRLQQWFLTELCEMPRNEMVCPIYLTAARDRDDDDLDAPLADVIDIGLARIRMSASGFKMLVLKTGDVLDDNADIYHREFDFRKYLFGPSPVNPICGHNCPDDDE